MNFGYVKDTAGITKPINLDDIKIINVTSDSITIRYNLIGTSNVVNALAFFVSFNNKGGISTDQIESQFYSWLKNALVSSSPLKASLNSAMPQLEIATAGLINSSGYRDATFLAAVDKDAACAATPTTACIVESKDGLPPVGTLVLANPSANNFDTIADGEYALEVSGTKYFATLKGSRITSIVVCPLLLDFVFDPNQQASGVVDDSNYVSLATFRYGDMPDYYNVSNVPYEFLGDDMGAGCSSLSYLKSQDDLTWPSGYIVNGFLGASGGLGQLPAFGLILADPNVANWNGAQLYISQDYYVTSDKDQATWSAFSQDFWLQGFTWFGNGTQNPANTSSSVSEILGNGYGRIFLPPGTSFSGNATFGSVQYVNYNYSGVLNNSSNCS